MACIKLARNYSYASGSQGSFSEYLAHDGSHYAREITKPPRGNMLGFGKNEMAPNSSNNIGPSARQFEPTAAQARSRSRRRGWWQALASILTLAIQARRTIRWPTSKPIWRTLASSRCGTAFHIAALPIRTFYNSLAALGVQFDSNLSGGAACSASPPGYMASDHVRSLMLSWPRTAVRHCRSSRVSMK